MNCAWCKQPEAGKSHGICGDCRKKFFPETLPGGADFEAAKLKAEQRKAGA
jgi:hypothetical protein